MIWIDYFDRAHTQKKHNIHPNDATILGRCEIPGADSAKQAKIVFFSVLVKSVAVR